jgi:hypothetical protein
MAYGNIPVVLSKTDLQKIIQYLDDAAKLYDALASLPMQKCNCRSHMIKTLNVKLKNKLK